MTTSRHPARTPPMQGMTLRRRDLLFAAGLTVFCSRGWAEEPIQDTDLAPAPVPQPRRLDLLNANTGETFVGLYRDAEGPIPSAMAELTTLLRDHHANKEGPLDVAALDFLADVMDATSQTHAIVLSAYRTPETNAMLARTTFGVAEHSQHMYGRALDVTFESRLPDAKTIALSMQRGGVGWYPRSHFVHLDTGPVRHWELDGSGFDLLLTSGRVRLGLVNGRIRPGLVTNRLVAHRALARHEYLARHGTR
jgi:uncharacterized protein YcbK (DUF882 family)